MNVSGTATKYQDLYADTFQEKIQEKANAILVDVRTPQEFESGRIPLT